MGLGFWSIRYSISTQRPALRAPDGGAPLEPISANSMRRGTYSGRVLTAMLFLCADGFCNLLDSCGAVWDRILGAGPSDADLLGAVILMVISLAARVFFIATLFW